MAIEVVVNGFYRSGTTMIWNLLKRSNPEKNIFYEPLNPYLSYYIRSEAYYDVPNPLHNMYLFQEYSQIGNGFIDQIVDKHPALNHPLPNNKKELYEYLQLFHVLDNSILQVNRLHFHLNDIHKKYNAKIIHVIRNPFDVYHSIVIDFYKHHYKSKWKFKYIYQYKFRKKHYLHLNHFDIKPMYDFIQKKYGYSIDYLEYTEDNSFKYFYLGSPHNVLSYY